MVESVILKKLKDSNGWLTEKEKKYYKKLTIVSVIALFLYLVLVMLFVNDFNTIISAFMFLPIILFAYLLWIEIPMLLGKLYARTKSPIILILMIIGVLTLFGIFFLFLGYISEKSNLKGKQNKINKKNAKKYSEKGKEFACDYCGKVAKAVWRLEDSSYACDKCYSGKK